MIKLPFAKDSKVKRLHIEPSAIDMYDDVEVVAREFVEQTSLSLLVENPHGSYKAPYEGREYDLCIYFWSLPETGDRHFLENAFGVSLSYNQNNAAKLKSNSRYISRRVSIYEDMGKEVAIIIGKTLYILFDLPHRGGEKVDYLFRRILADYKLYLTNREGFDAAMKVRLNDSALHFSSLVKISWRSHRVVEKLHEAEDKLNEARRELSACLRERNIWLSRVNPDSFEARDSETERKLRTVFANLQKYASNGVVKIDEESFTINVGQIDIEHNGAVYDIGEFEISINLESLEVYCENLTHTVDGYHHPHVFDDMTCCFGNASSGIATLLAEMEFDVVVMMVVEFLRSYNPDNCYEDIENWPLKDKGDDSNDRS